MGPTPLRGCETSLLSIGSESHLPDNPLHPFTRSNACESSARSVYREKGISPEWRASTSGLNRTAFAGNFPARSGFLGEKQLQALESRDREIEESEKKRIALLWEIPLTSVV